MPFEIPQSQDIPPGTYKAILEKVEERTGGKFGDGNFRVWDWIVDVNGKGELLSVSTSMNTGPRSTSYAWLTALLGRAPQAGEKIDDPTGKQVLLTIGKKDNGFPKVEAVSPYVDPQQTVPGIPR